MTSETGALKCPRTPGGKMQAIYTDDMIISAVQEAGEATPRDVADKLGCNAVVARNKLKALSNNGLIQSKNIAGRWVFWV